jgi:hypothetical protein
MLTTESSAGEVSSSFRDGVWANGVADGVGAGVGVGVGVGEGVAVGAGSGVAVAVGSGAAVGVGSGGVGVGAGGADVGVGVTVGTGVTSASEGPQAIARAATPISSRAARLVHHFPSAKGVI